MIETNQRLERIEGQFEEMKDVAVNAATIANGLQANAAKFQDADDLPLRKNEYEWEQK